MRLTSHAFALPVAPVAVLITCLASSLGGIFQLSWISSVLSALAMFWPILETIRLLWGPFGRCYGMRTGE